MLTFEHAPPLRVQKLLHGSKYRLVNPLDLVNEKTRGRQLPPARPYPRGLGEESLCKVCQNSTHHHYGESFYAWSVQGLRIAERIDPDIGEVIFPVRIQPLAVLKQIAVSALAISKFNPHYRMEHLRSFIQNPAEKHLPTCFEFFSYLNPPDVKYKLPQSRIATEQFQLDVTGKPSVFCLCDLSYPPFGYVVVWRELDDPLCQQIEGLTNISHFGNYSLNETVDVSRNFAVRTPFGPMALRYWQDAKAESQPLPS